MIEVIKNNRTTIVFSIFVHIVLITLLVFSFDWKAEPRALVAVPQNIVKAVVVDAGKIKAELDKLKRAETKKKNQEKARLEKLKREERKLRQKRAAEEKRIANLKKKRKAEEKKRKQEQKRLAKLKKEQKALKKKRAAEDKKRKIADEKRKADKARLAKKKKRETEAKQRRQELAQQLEAEERVEANKLVLHEINKYTALIEQKVKRNWLKPPGDLKSLLATLTISLIPGGDVIEVRIIRTSGNLIYDRSAERAVRKASPLPLPKDPAIAAKFYRFNFDFSK